MKLADVFIYDESSPSCLRWKIDIRSGRNKQIVKVRAGDAISSKNTTGYYQVCFNYKNYCVHKVIYNLLVDSQYEGEVDHKDGNRSNNKVGNLRPISTELNNRNTQKRKDNQSGTTGVIRRDVKRKVGIVSYWIAFWCEDGKILSKCFNIRKLGEKAAQDLAISFRADKILELNKSGAGYTERHGK